MTDLDTVRLITADPFTPDRFEAQADGVSDVIQLLNAPVLAGSARVFVAGVEDTTFTINLPIGLITLSALPTIDDDLIVTYQWSVFTDAELQTLLDLESGNIKLAAAQALDIMASSEALIQKRITLLDIKTDGPAEARALREHAKALRDQVAEGEDATGEGMFDYAELGLSPFGNRALINNDWLRRGPS